MKRGLGFNNNLFFLGSCFELIHVLMLVKRILTRITLMPYKSHILTNSAFLPKTLPNINRLGDKCKLEERERERELAIRKRE